MNMPIRLDPSDGYEFESLAIYNSEKGRGIAHTPEWDALMAKEQERFTQQQIDEWTAQGGHPIDPDDPDGAWIIPGPPPSLWDRLRWWVSEKVAR